MVRETVDLRIAELLTARLCHELVGPIGAIANGLEILGEEPDFAADAGALIGESAAQASRRLQFYRIAYGSTAALPDLVARTAVNELFAQPGKIRFGWPEAALPEGWLKLACNLVLLASEALTRGGEIRLETDGRGVTVTATGETLRLSELEPDLLDGTIDADEITPRTAQAVFTGLLARRLGADLFLGESSKGQIVLNVRPAT
jgi:histidine phosphotransferase ChpT